MARQHPTLQQCWVRSTQDAAKIFYGVATNLLRKVERRLDTDERRGIVSGNVYVWEERGANLDSTGLSMERWTDGMTWGPSRVREFLFYSQRDPESTDDPQDPSNRWAKTVNRRSALTTAPHDAAARHNNGPELLVKQTYSVHVSLPADVAVGITRKWHLTAYFSQDSIDQLYTVDDFPDVGVAAVPDGMFCSARVGNRSARRRSAENAKRRSSSPPRPHTQSSPAAMIAAATARPSLHPRRAMSTPMDPRLQPQAGPSTHHDSRVALGNPGTPPYSPSPSGPPDASGAHAQYHHTSRPRYHSSAATSAHPYRTYRDPVDPRSLPSSPSPTLSHASTHSSTAAYQPGSRPGTGPGGPAPPSSLRLAPLEYLQNLPAQTRHPVDDQFIQSFSIMA